MNKKIMEKLTAQELRRAESYLAGNDRVMKELIDQFGPCTLAKRSNKPFASLARTIIGQQLSAKAANAIEKRIKDTVGAGEITPESWLAVSEDELRTAGLSRPKIRYIGELANSVISGTVNFQTLKQMDESSCIHALTKLPGIGTWTAQMYLISCQKRPNILALDDAGLRRAARALYDDHTLQDMEPLWSPYCSVASWYLWKYLDE